MAAMDRVVTHEKRKSSVIEKERDLLRHLGSPRGPTVYHTTEEEVSDTSQQWVKKPKIRMAPVDRTCGAIRGGCHGTRSLPALRLSAFNSNGQTMCLPSPPKTSEEVCSSSEVVEMEALPLHGYHPHAFPPPSSLFGRTPFSSSTPLLSSLPEDDRVIPFAVLSSRPPVSSLPLTTSPSGTLPDPTASSLYLCRSLRWPEALPIAPISPALVPHETHGTVDREMGSTRDARTAMAAMTEEDIRVVEDGVSGDDDEEAAPYQGETAPWEDPPVLVLHRKGTPRKGRKESHVESVRSECESFSSSPVLHERTHSPVALPGWRGGPFPSTSTSRAGKRSTTWLLSSASGLPLPSCTPAFPEGRTAAGSSRTAFVSDEAIAEGQPERMSRTDATLPAPQRKWRSEGEPPPHTTRPHPSGEYQWANRIEGEKPTDEGVPAPGTPSLLPGIGNAAVGQSKDGLPPLLFSRGEAGDVRPLSDGEENMKTSVAEEEDGLDHFPPVPDLHSCCSSSSFSHAFDSVVSSTWSSIWQQECPPSNAVLPSSVSHPHHPSHQRCGAMPPSPPIVQRQTREQKASEGTHWFPCTDSFYVPFFASSEKKNGECSHSFPNLS